jgi:hypothetical protein
VTGDGLFLLSSEGSNTLARSCLIQGPTCGSHGRDVLLIPLGGSGDGGGCGGGGDLLPVDNGEVGVAARHGRQDGGGGWRRTLELGQK